MRRERSPHQGPTPPPRTARDFYSELILDSQTGRAVFLAERERWLRSVQVDGREELLFELEMLLRGVERYFNLHNHPAEPVPQPVVTRDFREELVHVRDGLEEVVWIARQLLDPDADQRMVFRRYVESRLADDRVRRALLEDELDQDSPQESLFLLRQSFDALRSLLDLVLKRDRLPYGVFGDVGTLLLREVVQNRYFRPFRSLEFRLEYDRIKSVPVLEALAELEPSDRRLFSVGFLGLFRLLHYLSYVSPEEQSGQLPPRAHVLLSLVRSEAAVLARYLEEELGRSGGPKKAKAAAVKVARNLARDLPRLSDALLGGADAEPDAPVEAAIALTELVREQVVLLGRALGCALPGPGAFEALVAREDLGRRLRLDLWGLSGLCEAAQRTVRRGPDTQARTALAAVRRFIDYFQGVSYQLLRYGDYEPVDRFVALLAETPGLPQTPALRERLADDLHLFAQVAQGLFLQVSRRREVSPTRFDAKEGRALLSRFRSG